MTPEGLADLFRQLAFISALIGGFAFALAAVRAFQRQHGLVSDGIVGPKTWDLLGA